MKALYESILDDIDVQMSNGDEWVKQSKAETEKFLKALGTRKSYDPAFLLHPKNTETLRCRLFAPYTIEQLGFNANAIKIIIGTLDETGDWKIKISIYTVEDQSKMGTAYVKPLWEKKVYIDYTEFNKTSDIVRGLIKPAAKSLDRFKKFLNNVEKWNEQLVGTNLLLK